MVKERDLQGAQALRTGGRREPGKAQLQRQMEEARESISQTVEEIKDTVEGQYESVKESVKETVSGVLDYREQFQKDPIVWSVGALSAGFALGYTLGYAHKNMKPAGRKRSEVAAFADSLSTVGNSLVMPSLNAKIKQLFGFDFSDMLEEIGGAKKTPARKKLSGKDGAKKESRGARIRVPTVKR